MTGAVEAGTPVFMSMKPLIRKIANAALALPGLHALARALGRSGILPADAWQRLWSGYPLEGIVTLAAAGTRFRYHVSPGDHIGMPLYWCGPKGYEPETLAKLADFLGDARVFYDIGANTGLFTLVAAQLKPDLRIIALEPNPETAARLRENIALNGLESRITMVEAAVAAEAGQLAFDVPDAVFALSSTLGAGDDAPPGHRRIRVAAVTLADLVARFGAPDAIKIDAEGHEADILDSAADVLAAAPPLLIEVLDDAPFARLASALSPPGYRFARLGNSAPVFGVTLGPRGTDEGRNVWCARA